MTDDPDRPEPPDNIVPLFARPPGATPRPPELVDPRQARTRQILGNLGRQLGVDAQTGNLESGSPASAVDLGRLQDLLEARVLDLDIDELRGRWEGELAAQAEQIVLQWAQRVKALGFEVRHNGVHVRLETQDDRGYYHYAFDFFPGRRTPR